MRVYYPMPFPDEQKLMGVEIEKKGRRQQIEYSELAWPLFTEMERKFVCLIVIQILSWKKLKNCKAYESMKCNCAY